MIKAVVLDITDGEATVMTKAGDIIGVIDRSYDLGQEITVEDISEKTISFTEKISRFILTRVLQFTASSIIICFNKFIKSVDRR